VIEIVREIAAVVGFSLRILVSSTNESDRHDITEILLKIAVNIITPNPISPITIFKMCLFKS